MKNNEISLIQYKTDDLPASEFNWSHDVNTSFGFGVAQPVVCKWLPPKTKTEMSLRNLIRLAPLSAPAFARIKYKTLSHFVAFSDLFQDFPHLLSQTPLARGQNLLSIEKLPHISLGLLSYLCLVGAKCTVYHTPGQASAAAERVLHRIGQGYATETQANNAFDTLFANTNLFSFNHHSVEFPHFVGTVLNLYSIYGNRFGTQDSTALSIPLANVDKVSFFEVVGNPSIGDRPRSVLTDNSIAQLGHSDVSIELQCNGYGVTLCFNLSDFGKRIYSTLIGCGYQFDIQSKTKVSLMPLFATWKSYFDDYGIVLYDNYFSSNLYKLLTHIDYYNAVDLNLLFAHKEFISFIVDLGNMWVTNQQDYTSAHIESTAVSPSFGLSKEFIDVDGSAHITEVDNFDPNNLSVNGHSFIDAVKHGHLDSEYLKRIYISTNKNTVIGRAVADILRSQGLGDFVDNTKSHFIGTEETPINIDAVVSQSDTFAETESGSTGKVLGSYAGLGVGANYGDKNTPKQLVYSNDEFGYWITLGAVIPDSGYTQQLDSSLLAIDKNSLYNPQFDGLGYEATRKQQIVGSQMWCDNPTEETEENTLDATFGFISRYAGLKIQPSKLNGSFALGSVKDSFQQYTCDKVINVGDKQVETKGFVSNGNYTLYQVFDLLTPSRLPTASIIWRYISRYAFLGNLNRIFAYVGIDPSNTHYLFDNNDAVEELRAKFEYILRTEDNFMLHHVVNMRGWAHMKPIERSFETFDEHSTPNAGVAKA